MNPLSIAPDRLERLRALCLQLPEATEKEAWGDPTWRIRGRIFAMQKGNFEGGRPSLWLKAPDGAQSALVEGDPKLFFVPGYVGHKGWVGVYLDARGLPWPLIGNLIEESYQLIAPRRLGAALATHAGSQLPTAPEKAPPRRSSALEKTSARKPASRRKRSD